MWTLPLLWSVMASAQVVPVTGPPLTRLQEYLSLSDAQMESLIGNVRTQAAERALLVRRVNELRQALLAEAAREGADPMTLGNLAVERENVCREDRQGQAVVTERALSILNAAQRTRLQALEEARRLDAVMQEAQSLALLDGAPIPFSGPVTVSLPGCVSGSISGLILGGPFFPTPTFAAKQYLNLSDAQYRVLTENAQRHINSLTNPLQSRISDLNRGITLETAREQLDPAALGALYAELAGMCQEQEGRYRELRRSAESILSDAQKTRLSSLRASQALVPVIAEAQSAGLLSNMPIAGVAGRFGFPQQGCSVP